MQHVLNVLHVRGPQRPRQSREVRRQTQRHILTICVIVLAGLALLVVATLRASDDARFAGVGDAGLVPQEQASVAPAVMRMSSSRPAEQHGPASTGPADRPASTSNSDEAPDAAAAERTSLLDAAADGATPTTVGNDARTGSSAPADGLLSIHSVNASLNKLANRHPGASASARELHLGTDRLSPVQSGGAMLIALDRAPEISSGGLLSMENITTMRGELFDGGSGAFDFDVFEAEGMGLLPPSAPTYRQPVAQDGSAARAHESAGAPVVVPGDEPIDDAAQPSWQSGLLDADETDHAEGISSAAAAGLSESVRDRPAGLGRVPQGARSVPEPFAMPLLMCGCLLTTGRSRRRRHGHGDESRVVQALRDARSYKLPPGSSDLTLDQVAALRRRTGICAAA